MRGHVVCLNSNIDVAISRVGGAGNAELPIESYIHLSTAGGGAGEVI